MIKQIDSIRHILDTLNELIDTVNSIDEITDTYAEDIKALEVRIGKLEDKINSIYLRS